MRKLSVEIFVGSGICVDKMKLFPYTGQNISLMYICFKNISGFATAKLLVFWQTAVGIQKILVKADSSFRISASAVGPFLKS